MIVNRNGIWHAVFRCDGRHVWRSLGTSDEAAARGLAEALHASIRSQRTLRRLFGPLEPQRQAAARQAKTAVPAQAPASPDREGVKIAELYGIAGKYRRLAAEHRQALAAFAEWCASRNVVLASEVTPPLALQYLQERYGNASGKTYNNNKGRLNVLFSACLVETGMDSSPFKPLMSRRLEAVRHHASFTMEECRRIVEAARPSPYWHCLCMLAMYTGQRLKTCRIMAPCHVRDGRMTLTPTKTARYGRAVEIPILPELAEYLESLPVVDSQMPYCKLFPSQRYWPGTGKMYLSGLLESLSIEGKDGEEACFGSFRCAFITRLSELGVSERTIQGIVGHVDKETTRLYNHDTATADREIRGIAEAYSRNV